MPGSSSHPGQQVLYPSPPLSRGSEDSNTSLRALELSESPEGIDERSTRRNRTSRSYSLSGFQFEHDLLPLSLSESIQSGGQQVSKNVGIFKGETNSPRTV
jgi:hypothetical protein